MIKSVRRLGLVCCALVVGVADATTLGGIRAQSLVSQNVAATASAAVVVTCDNYTGTTGALLSSRAVTAAASCANAVWTTHVGTWTIQSNQAASSTTSNATATLNVGSADCTVQAVMTGLATVDASAGVVTSHNGTSTYLGAVLIKNSPDRIELRLYQFGVASIIATATTTIVTSNTLSLTRSASNVSVALNGTTVLTTTLTPTQSTALGTGKRSGLFGNNSSVRYDDFLVTNP